MPTQRPAGRFHVSVQRDAGQPSGLSAAFGGLRHRAGERLALPLYHRCLRRRGLRGRLPALPAGRPAGDDHGIRRGPCVPQQHGAGPEGPAARGHALAHLQQDPPVGQLPALHVLHHGHRLDAGLLLAQLFRQPFRSGHRGRGVLFRQHPGQPLRTGAGHDHRGGRGLPGLRHGRAEGRGARGQGHHGGPAGHPGAAGGPQPDPARCGRGRELLSGPGRGEDAERGLVRRAQCGHDPGFLHPVGGHRQHDHFRQLPEQGPLPDR